MITEVEHPELGKLRTHNTPLKLSRTPAKAERAAPELGEHSEEVLKGLLGMTDEEVARLREEGVI